MPKWIKQYTPQEIEDEKVKRARALFATRPSVTKIYLVRLHKFSIEFLHKHWNKITS